MLGLKNNIEKMKMIKAPADQEKFTCTCSMLTQVL